jgi:hypothetical protein
MIAVHFSKEFAAQVLDAINNGNPIPVPPGDWNGNNLLTLTGVLFTAVFAQAPHAYQLAGISPGEIAKTPFEHREAIEGNFNRDIHQALDFLSMLTFRLLARKYDDKFAKEVKAIVRVVEGGTPEVIPIQGFKDYQDMV